MSRFLSGFTVVLVVLAMLVVANGSIAAESTHDCLYRLESDSIHVEWTGYKTTEKAGVKGSFKAVMVKAPAGGAKNIAKALEGATFSIDSTTVTSGNDARDASLREAFFMKLIHAEKISGKLKKVQLEANAGRAILQLELNGKKKSIPVELRVDPSDQITLSGEIDVLHFGAENALQSLHQKCEELHKGKDGVSKTWSTVLIAASGKLSCQKKDR